VERNLAFASDIELLFRNRHTGTPVWTILLKICKSCLILSFINYALNMRCEIIGIFYVIFYLKCLFWL